MGFFDFLSGGNSKVAARSTLNVFNDGISMFSSEENAYKYLYIFRYNTISKYIKNKRDEHAASLFRDGKILNCTDITVANLNTGAAPSNIYFEQTHQSFHEGISKHLRSFGMQERYITGNNNNLVLGIISYLRENNIVPSNEFKRLIVR